MKTRMKADHPDRLRALGSLAATMNVKKALPILEEVVEILRAKFGDAHSRTWPEIHNLAIAYANSGQNKKALQLFIELHEILIDKFGEQHPDTIRIGHSLGQSYVKTGMLAKGFQTLENALELREIKLDATHPEIIHFKRNMARSYQWAGQKHKSLPLWEEVLEHQDDRFGRLHPSTQASILALGKNYKDVGRLDKALELLEELVQTPSNKSPYLDAVPLLIDVYQKREMSEQASALTTRHLKFIRESLPQDSLPFAYNQARVCQVYFLPNESFAEAELMLRDSLNVAQRVSETGLTTWKIESLLGKVLLAQQKLAKCEPMLLELYEGIFKFESHSWNQYCRIEETIHKLIRLYEARHAFDPNRGYDSQVAHWQQKLSEHKLKNLFYSQKAQTSESIKSN